tara:strand:+ start:2621 stop:3325 length:705 start_codon:yes stop_codon:yes gene_type:complete
MKYKSKGIALTYIKYGETSIISKVFTQEHGLQSFIIKGARGKSSKKRVVFFEPLTLINITANYNLKKSLQFLSEVNAIDSIYFTKQNMNKKFIAFFLAEVCSKILQEGEKNESLFNFVWNRTKELQLNNKTEPNFVLKYMLDLSSYLGFYPSRESFDLPYFSLTEGCFVAKNIVGETLSKKKSTTLKSLMNNNECFITQGERTNLLQDLFLYYSVHNHNLSSVKSHLIIQGLRV